MGCHIIHHRISRARIPRARIPRARMPRALAVSMCAAHIKLPNIFESVVFIIIVTYIIAATF